MRNENWNATSEVTITFLTEQMRIPYEQIDSIMKDRIHEIG